MELGGGGDEGRGEGRGSQVRNGAVEWGGGGGEGPWVKGCVGNRSRYNANDKYLKCRSQCLRPAAL